MDGFKSFLADFVGDEAASRGQRGFVDAFRRAQERDGGAGAFFSDEQLVIAVQDFFTGGSGTMSKTLSFAALLMARHPGEQRAARQEIRNMLRETGSDLVEASHRSRLPLLEATLLEVQRLASVLPIAPPRMVAEDVTIAGYSIRKGTPVQLNLYSLHHDPSHWEEPHAFRPGRFLQAAEGGGGLRVRQDDWLQPFGYGRQGKRRRQEQRI